MLCVCVVCALVWLAFRGWSDVSYVLGSRNITLLDETVLPVEHNVVTFSGTFRRRSDANRVAVRRCRPLRLPGGGAGYRQEYYGHGLPIRNEDGNRGKLFVEFRVVFPRYAAQGAAQAHLPGLDRKSDPARRFAGV